MTPDRETESRYVSEMRDAKNQPATVNLVVTNRSAELQTLVLEPLGEIYALEPGQTKTVLYVGDPEPHLSIDLGDGETKIWAEGSGTLSLD